MIFLTVCVLPGNIYSDTSAVDYMEGGAENGGTLKAKIFLSDPADPAEFSFNFPAIRLDSLAQHGRY